MSDQPQYVALRDGLSYYDFMTGMSGVIHMEYITGRRVWEKTTLKEPKAYPLNQEKYCALKTHSGAVWCENSLLREATELERLIYG